MSDWSSGLSATVKSQTSNSSCSSPSAPRPTRSSHEDSEGEALTRAEFTEPLERLLRDGAADGTLREANYEKMATVLFNLVGWTYVHMRTGHR